MPFPIALTPLERRNSTHVGLGNLCGSCVCGLALARTAVSPEGYEMSGLRRLKYKEYSSDPIAPVEKAYVELAVEELGREPEAWSKKHGGRPRSGRSKSSRSWPKTTRLDPTLLKLWEQEVFALLLGEGKITGEVVANIRSWKHSGFSVDQSVRLDAGDREGLGRLMQYFVVPSARRA